MERINFENNVTKANADTFNTLQDNIEDGINDASSALTTYVDNLLSDDYTDISSQITKLRPSDLAIQSAYAKKIGKITILDIIFKTSTGFDSGGAAEPIASLPNDLKPSQGIRSTCWVHVDNSYSTWDGITGSNNGAIMGWLYITTTGHIYVRFPTVSGLTRKAVQIHIAY